MFRPYKILFFFALISLATAMLVITALSILSAALMMPPVQRRLTTMVERIVSEHLTSTVSIGSLRTNFMNRIDLHDVVMAGRRPSGDKIKICHLGISFSPLSFLSKKIILRKIVINGASWVCVRTRDGVLSAPFLPESRKEKPHKKGEQAWKVYIDSALVKGFDASYIDSALSIDASLDSIEIEAIFLSLDSFSVKLSGSHGGASTPWWRGGIRQLQVEGTVSPSAIDLASVLIEGDSAAVSGKGIIAYGKGGVWNLEASASTSRDALVVLDRIKSIGRGGDLTARARWRGAFENPYITLDAAATGVSVAQLPVDTLRIDAEYKSNGKLSGVIMAVLPCGTAKATVQSRMPGLVTGPDLKQYSIEASLKKVMIDDLLRNFGVKGKLPRSLTDVNLSAQGRSFSALPDSLAVKAVLHNETDNREEKGVCVSARLYNGAWQAHLSDNAHNILRAHGKTGRENAVSGSFSFFVTNPVEITRFLLEEPTSGILRGSGNFSGNIRKPEISAVIYGEKVTWNGIMVDDIHGSVRYAGGQLQIDSVEMETSGELGTSLSRFGIKDVSGRFTVTAAGSGPFKYPDLNAHLVMRDLNARGFHAPMLEATGALRNDTIIWRDLRISNDSATIVSSGTAKLYTADRFVNTSMVGVRRGFRNGTVAAFVTLVGDTLAGHASVTSFSPALVEPWFDTPIPFAGELSLRTELGGAVQNPEVALSFDFRQAFEQDRNVDVVGEMILHDSTMQGKIQAFTGTVRQPLSISASIPVSLRKQWTVKNGVRDGADIKAQGTDVNVQELLEAFFPLFSANGTVALDAEAVKHSGTWHLSGNAATRITALSDSSHGVYVDTLHARADFSGSKEGSSARFVFSTSGAAWQDRRLDALNGKGRYINDTLFLDTLKALIGNGSLFVTGAVPRMAFDAGKKESGVRVSFLGSKIPIASLGSFRPGVVPQNGTVSADGTIEFKHGKLAVFGHMSLHNAILQLFECTPNMGPINADIAFEGDSLVVKSLRGSFGDAGSFHGSGFTRFGVPHRARFILSARDLLRIRCGDLDLGIQKISLAGSDSADMVILSGTVDLAETRYATFFSFNNILDQLDRARPGPTEKNDNTFLERVALRGMINLRRNLVIETNLGRFVLDGKVAVVGTLRKPGAIGTMNTIEGYVYYLDRKFNIQKGTFLLQDPYSIAPVVDLTATTDVMSFEVAGQDREVAEKQYTITLCVKGDLSQPEITLTAYPFLRPVQIVSLLTVGTTQGDIGANIAGRIGTLLKLQLAGFGTRGTRKLEQLLDIERLDITPAGKTDAVVTAVKRLSPRLTVSYQTSTDDLTKPRIKASYRLWPFLYFDGTGDYAGRAGADLRLRWSK